jgi:hypothetical protein
MAHRQLPDAPLTYMQGTEPFPCAAGSWYCLVTIPLLLNGQPQANAQ